MRRGLVFKAQNYQIESSGKPPGLQARPGRRTSYFENHHGEQLVFVYEQGNKKATLYHGDRGWGRPFSVDVKNGSTRILLNSEEKLWLAGCLASTEFLRDKPRLKKAK